MTILFTRMVLEEWEPFHPTKAIGATLYAVTTCSTCRYISLPTTEHPCDKCMDFRQLEPIQNYKPHWTPINK